MTGKDSFYARRGIYPAHSHVILTETLSYRQTMKALGAKTLKEIGDIYREFDVIGIDEGQFFPDVSFFFDPLSSIDSGMVRPGSQRREGRHHLCPRWHVLEDRLRVHPPTHP